MKKKKNSKILLFIVIIIWGFLFYKIYDAFRPNPKNIRTKAPETFIPPPNAEKDTFSLLPIERDPFLGTLYVKKNEKKIIHANKNKKKEDDIVWPDIKYLGIVSDQDASTSVFILQINGRQHLIKKGESIEGIQLVYGSNNNLQLRYKGKIKKYPLM